MSSSSRPRLLNQMARNAAWSSSAWLAVMVGCVDAPRESFTPVETTAAPAASATDNGMVQADLNEVAAPADTTAAQVAPAVPAPSPVEVEPTVKEPQPTLASDIEGTVPSPGLFPIPEPEPGSEPTLTSDPSGEPLVPQPDSHAPAPLPTLDSPAELTATDNTAAPTPLAETPATSDTPAPFPGADQSVTSLRPESLEPTPADESEEPSTSEPAPTPPVAASPPGLPVANANDNPLESNKPRGYIHINPKQKSPDNAGIPDSNVNQNIINKATPAVVLPPSAEADAASLAPLPEKSTEAPTTENASEVPPATPKGIVASPVSISAAESDNAPPVAIPEGFTPLFNHQDMTGWEVIDGKADSWEFKDGIVSCVAPGGGWIQTLAMYSDFELRFEYRLSPGGNSGVSLRYPGHGNPSLEGLEIQLIDDQAEKYKDIQPQQATGSLYFAAAPQVRDASHSAGIWNLCAVRCVGQRLEVSINDKLVNEVDLTQINTRVEGVPHSVASIRSPMGSIALQSHATRVDFRQVALRDLTQVMTAGVRYLDLQEGAGDAVPPGASVTVHYIGHLNTGKRFANSVEKNKPVTVDLRDVIPGWREGIPGMKVGGKRRLVVPPEMAYGEKGFKEVVPPNSTLVYEIELLEFVPAQDEVPLEAAEATPAETETK